PGKWIQHSYHVAKSAEIIANKCLFDNNSAYILGLLHDIGRYEGFTYFRHVYAGYKLMKEKGYYNIAKICLTHSFPLKNIESYNGDFDCKEHEVHYLKNELEKTVYDDYDKLIQLCDCLCSAEGVNLLECRMVDVVSRHGFNKYTLNKWDSLFECKRYFDEKCNMNIYELFYEDIRKNILKNKEMINKV
ncbi:MAG: HD domain-containing protein, partial [Treponema sp.]|nr:HD domain-containing protein [Treponema sp.]